jgi:hypothetical protein
MTLRAVSQPIDETPAGKFMEGIFAALSQELLGKRGNHPGLVHIFSAWSLVLQALVR